MENRLDAAVAAYRQVLRQKPKWAEGWYFAGSILYEQEKGKECAAAFERFTALMPKVSAGQAFLGLCRYQARDYANSLSALLEAQRIGMPAGEPLTDVAGYHAALLFIKAQNFEGALQILHLFSRRPEVAPKIIEATGIAALRMPIFPEELKDSDRELVYRMGRAVITASARHAAAAAAQFDEIVRDFPTTPNVHYAWGTFLLGGDPDKAIAALSKELEVQKEHLPTLVLLSLEYLKRGDAAAAKPYADRAVKAGPNNFTSHVVLGRTLVALGEIEAGVIALELAARLEPTSPQARIALASAYQRAGRPQDAAKQRAEFQRLKNALDSRESVQ
jgi:tetratricopeptide (TPR) repeat protein